MHVQLSSEVRGLNRQPSLHVRVAKALARLRGRACALYWAKKETPHIKHILYMGEFHQSLANDLSQFER